MSRHILMCLKDRYPITRPDVEILLALGGEREGYQFDFLCRAEDGIFSRRVEPLHGSRVIAFPGYFGRGGLNYLLDCWRYVELIGRTVFGDYQAILIRDEYFSAILACLFARIVNKPFIYWMSFPMYVQYEEAAAAASGLKGLLLGFKSRMTKFALFRFSLPAAQHIFCQSQSMLASLASMGIDSRKMTPVPMGVDFSNIDNISTQMKVALHPQGVAHLCCLTVHSGVRQLDVLLDAAACLEQRGLKFKLWMIGGEDVPGEIERLKAYAMELKISESVEFTGLLPQLEAFHLVQQCHVGISVIPRGRLFDVSSPTKLLEYIALGVPVVANDIPDQSYIVHESQFGAIVEFNPSSIADGITLVLNDNEFIRGKSKSACEFIKSQRSYDALISTVFVEFDSIIRRESLS